LIERVLLAIEDSAGSVAAVRAAVGLAAACGAALDIVTVLGDAVAAGALATASSPGQVLRRRERAATALLRRAPARALPDHHCPLTGTGDADERLPARHRCGGRAAARDGDRVRDPPAAARRTAVAPRDPQPRQAPSTPCCEADTPVQRTRHLSR
jgi:hypothetical protein